MGVGSRMRRDWELELDHSDMRVWKGTTERDLKKTVGVSKAMKGEERIGNERRDTPTTSISHERRGSALAAERAGRDEGRGGWKRRRAESGGSKGWTAYPRSS